jgi:hypothetical protein
MQPLIFIGSIGDTMNFESVGPSAVKSIRQRDFLKEWMRHYVPHQTLPAFATFKPARIDDDMPDLMFYDVEYAGTEPRYLVTHEGKRLADAYGVTGIGRYLQDTLSPPVWQYIEPIYRKCVAVALPVYSAFQVRDAEGRKVSYERLLLPFGEGHTVRNMVTSLKPISEEGRFINANLMHPDDHAPDYTLRAVISDGLAGPSRPTSIEGDVVSL